MIISFEGIPGVGKSTLVRNFDSYLKSVGWKVTSIRELDLIDGTRSSLMDLAMDVFSCSKDRYFRQFDPFIDTYFAQAVRYLICQETLDRYSPDYDVILEDRGVDTYYSYALAGLKIVHNYPFDYSLSLLSGINNIIDNVADYTFRLRDTVESCVNRSILRGESSVLQKDIGFVTEVNNAYDFIADQYKSRIITVNVNENDANAVFNLCLEKLAERGVFFNRDS